MRAYALGIADDPERTEIAEHLARQVPDLHGRSREARWRRSALMSGAVNADGSAEALRRRVIVHWSSRNRRVRGRCSFLPWAIAGVLAIALLRSTLPAALRSADITRSWNKLSRSSTIRRRRTCLSAKAESPRGRVFVSADKGVVFIAAHLPALIGGQDVRALADPRPGKSGSRRTFQSNADATAVYVRPGPVDNAAAIAVTVEPRADRRSPPLRRSS